MFCAIDFFNDYNIRYWTEGKNVGKGMINTTCPHCGDRSNHLGWNGFGTRCWKCGYHSLFDSIKEILSIDNKETYIIINKYQTDSNYIPILDESLNNGVTEVQMIGGNLELPHKKYLEGRGFDSEFLEWKYGLKGTLARNDFWRYRIIAPIMYKNRLVSYQGRDYTNKQDLRYYTLGKDKELIHHKNILFNLDNCKKDKVIVCEGVYDVMRMGDDCCGTFGTSTKNEQLNLLAKRFNKIFLVFDPEEEALERAKIMASKLSMMGKDVEIINLDDNKDPAEHTDEEAQYIKKELNF